MRSPSARCLNQTVDLYRMIRTITYQDADGGLLPAGSYPDTPDVAAIPCAVNPDYSVRLDSEHGRVTDETPYVLVFATDPGCTVMDKFTWNGLNLFADGGAIDMAGHSGAYGVRCTEQS